MKRPRPRRAPRRHEFTDSVVAYVRRVCWEKRPRNGWWVVHVEQIAEALGAPTSSVLTALRKAEDRQLLRLHGDPPHSVGLGPRIDLPEENKP